MAVKVLAPRNRCMPGRRLRKAFSRCCQSHGAISAMVKTERRNRISNVGSIAPSSRTATNSPENATAAPSIQAMPSGLLTGGRDMGGGWAFGQEKAPDRRVGAARRFCGAAAVAARTLYHRRKILTLHPELVEG